MPNLTLFLLVCEVGRKQGFKPAELVEEWVSFSCSHEDCPLDSYNIERFSSQVNSLKY